MVSIRGTRFTVTPTADESLPEGERRAFTFLNPSVKTYERLEEACKGETDGFIKPTALVHKLLRGWSNVKTEDPDIAAKYGVVPQDEKIPEGGVEIPFPVAGPVDLTDVLSILDWRDLVKQLFTTVMPVTSGN